MAAEIERLAKKAIDEFRNSVISDDEEAEALFRLLHAPITTHIRLKLSVTDHGLLGDAFQLFMIRLLNAQSRFDLGQPFLPWARKIAENVAISYLRTLRSARLQFGLDDKEQRETGCAVERMHTDTIIDEALNCLPSDDRQLFELKYLFGYTDQEISAELGISVATVKRRHQRGVRKLREHMKTAAIKNDAPHGDRAEGQV